MRLKTSTAPVKLGQKRRCPNRKKSKNNIKQSGLDYFFLHMFALKGNVMYESAVFPFIAYCTYLSKLENYASSIWSNTNSSLELYHLSKGYFVSSRNQIHNLQNLPQSFTHVTTMSTQFLVSLVSNIPRVLSVWIISWMNKINVISFFLLLQENNEQPGDQSAVRRSQVQFQQPAESIIVLCPAQWKTFWIRL